MKGIGFDQLTAFQERLDTLQQAAENAPADLQALLEQTIAELSVGVEEFRATEAERRQQAEPMLAIQQTLEAERERYRDLFDFAPDGYLVTNPHGVIKEANYAAANLLQIAPAFLFGKPLHIYITLQDRRTFMNQLTAIRSQTILDFQSLTWETYLKPRKGPLIPVNLTVVPKFDSQGKLTSLRWQLRDISAAKQAEADLRASEALSRAILNSLDAHIAVLDQEGVIIAVNEGWQRFAVANGDPELAHTGIGANYLHVCRFAFGEAAHTARQVLAGIEAVLDGSLGIFTLEYPCSTPGENHWFTLYVTPLKDVEGGGAVVSHVNITERKRVEEEKSRLLQEVRQQQEQLRALSQRVVEVQEAERQQLAMELHDQVGQKLTALDLNLNVIWARLAETPGGTDLIKARLDDSLALVEETATTIRNVMSSLRPAMLDDYGLAAAIRWYGEQVARRAGFKLSVQNGLAVRLPEPVESAFFRIAQEALNNVVKHAGASEVNIKLEDAHDLVRMIVADNGRGFEPAQIAEANGRPTWGLMTMTERAIAVGAEYQVESQPDQGTQIIIEIKREAQTAPPPYSRTGELTP